MTVRFDSLGVVVKDMPTSLAFYRRLGLDIPAEADTEGHVEVALAGGLRLMFDTEEIVRSFDPTWKPPSGRGRIGLAFRCDDPAQVDETVEALAAHGYRIHLHPFDAFWGQRYASMLDPDGNVVDLFAPLG